jgi:hypothetical protein
MTSNSTQEGTATSLTESKKRGPGRPRKTPKPQEDGSELGQTIQSDDTNSSVDVEYDKGDDSVVQQVNQSNTTTAAPNVESKPPVDGEASVVIPKQPTKIHLIDGEKGGVGKSLFARVVIQYHLDNELPFIAVETDRSNPAIAGIYSDVCRFAFFSEDENQLDKADPIYNFALEKPVIVDLPAQAYRPVKDWIVKNNLMELGKEDSVSFYKWFVCDGGYDSLKLLKQTLKEFGDDIQHILVRNLGKCEDWQHLALDEELQGLLTSKEVKIIDFPKFYHMERNSIDMRRLKFSEALESTNFHSISRQRIKSFLRESYGAIAELALFGGGL